MNGGVRVGLSPFCSSRVTCCVLFCVESLLNSEAALVCVFAQKRQYFYAYYIMTVNSSSRGQSHGAFARVLFVLVLFVCFRASSAQQSFNKRFIRRDGASFSFFSSSGGGLEREERFLALGANEGGAAGDARLRGCERGRELCVDHRRGRGSTS